LYYLIEVEYDGKQDEKDQYKAKMKEVDKIETLRKMKEDLGKFKIKSSHLIKFLFFKKIKRKLKKLMIHLVHV
jgi:galactitol-specific phosphotransferase system IIB component